MRREEAIHTPGTMDNRHWADNLAFEEDNLQMAHNWELAVDNCAFEEGKPVAGIRDRVDMPVEKKEHPRDAEPVSQTRVRDRRFEDRHEN